jgi:hypothetical protein
MVSREDILRGGYRGFARVAELEQAVLFGAWAMMTVRRWLRNGFRGVDAKRDLAGRKTIVKIGGERGG